MYTSRFSINVSFISYTCFIQKESLESFVRNLIRFVDTSTYSILKSCLLVISFLLLIHQVKSCIRIILRDTQSLVSTQGRSSLLGKHD